MILPWRFICCKAVFKFMWNSARHSREDGSVNDAGTVYTIYLEFGVDAVVSTTSRPHATNRRIVMTESLSLECHGHLLKQQDQTS